MLMKNSLLREGMRTAVTCQAVEGELPINFNWFRDNITIIYKREKYQHFK